MKTRSIAAYMSPFLVLCGLVTLATACPPPQCPDCYYWDGDSCEWACGDQGMCCSGSCCYTDCCNNTCCDSGQTCCGSDCCGNTCCYGTCCDSGQNCCGVECCSNACCASTCCDDPMETCCGTICCISGCCEYTHACCGKIGKVCCDDRECYDASTQKCCGDGNGHVCDIDKTCCGLYSCCQADRVCCDGECCSEGECCDEGLCEALEGCESCIDGITTDDPNKCTGECNNCTDAQCHDDDDLCDPGDVCVDGTCCDTASAGDCTVTDEDVGYDPDDCVRNMAGAGQCTGGWGTFIAAYNQSSTHENATGPGTEDVDGCADVTYAKCKTIFIGLDKGYWWDCILILQEFTENMGTHDECPTE